MAPKIPVSTPRRRRRFEWPEPELCEQVLLRPWQPADGPALVEAWADEEMIRYTGVPANPTLSVAQRFIGGVDERRRLGSNLDMVVADPAQPETVWGEVGLQCPNADQPVALIGWWTMPDHRGCGVATNAVQLMANWALTNTFLEALVAQIEPENEPSQRLARNAGFVQHPRHLRSWQVDRKLIVRHSFPNPTIEADRG